MSGIGLSPSTGNGHVDALLYRVIGRVEQALPEQIRGYYVVGSHADSSALPARDIDLVTVVKGSPDDEGANAKQFVLRKRDAPRLYRQYVGDEWAPFLDTLYARCRHDWRYDIPVQADDREALREVCVRYFAFENHFLSAYKDFVLSELQGDNEPAVYQALRALRRLPYRDEHIAAALQAIGERGTLELRQAAADTLAYY